VPIEPREYAIIMAETLSEAVQKLWELDSNRCEPNQDYQLNVQEGKKPYVLLTAGLLQLENDCGALVISALYHFSHGGFEMQVLEGRFGCRPALYLD
jgi:hypothetical protein